ncbi:SpoIIE family protein phosphatase [Nocardioides sp. GCM10027113]|uniref:SpoIIE family protein phosphatase n=1 Tax=unclassified Nocardioides TaxID=2615069 RepID=UPI00360D3C23
MARPEIDRGDPAAALAGYDHSPFLLVALDGPEHVVVAANDRARASLGPRPLGTPGRRLLPGSRSDWLWRACDQVLRDGRPFQETGLVAGAADAEARDILLDVELRPWRRPDGSVRGVLGYGHDATARRRAEAERHARAAAEAVVEQEQGVVTALHDALLPLTLPVLPGLQVAAHYLLADEGSPAGGDWFDVVRLADDRVALVVGDCVGHGVAAASVMGRLQSVLHERLASGASVAEALTALDRYAADLPDAAGATVCVASLDLRSGEVEYLTAGHPPPLVVDRRGDFRYLDPSGSRPLALAGVRRSAHARIGPDELLVLYSDGIIERPGRTSSEATIELGQVAGQAFAHRPWPADLDDPDRPALEVLEQLVTRTGRRDDVTLLTAGLVDPPQPLELDLPADPSSVTLARDEVTMWLTTLGVRRIDARAIVHATTEIVANAVHHAYTGTEPDPGAPAVAVRGELTRDAVVRLTVRDGGAWHDAADSGRGLALAGGLVDRMSVDRGDAEHGTTVTLERAAAREAQLLRTPAGRRTTAPPGPPGARVLHSDPGRLVAGGPLDWDNVDGLRAALLESTSAGVQSATVDLTQVTHLASAAVLALLEAQKRAAQHGTSVDLVAPMGSAAQHVLDVAGMPYLPEADGGGP